MHQPLLTQLARLGIVGPPLSSRSGRLQLSFQFLDHAQGVALYAGNRADPNQAGPRLDILERALSSWRGFRGDARAASRLLADAMAEMDGRPGPLQSRLTSV